MSIAFCYHLSVRRYRQGARSNIAQISLRQMKYALSWKSSQHHAVSGRMITDLEMNGTYRRAVQITNLCRHLRHDDVLFAECTSTFASCQLYGRTMN